MSENNRECVWVRWRDSASRDGWTSLSGYEDDVIEIDTVGFVLEDNEDRLTVGQSMDINNGDGKAAGIMIIPRECITDIWVVK